MENVKDWEEYSLGGNQTRGEQPRDETRDLVDPKILKSRYKAPSELLRSSSSSVGEPQSTGGAIWMAESPSSLVGSPTKEDLNRDFKDPEPRDASRKRQTLQTWTKRERVTTRAGHDDGFSWRKYGQKDILCEKYPRHYYKCIHRFCSARKHVQQIDEDPTFFQTTYQGIHDCTQASNKIPTVVSLENQEPNDNLDSQYLYSFTSSIQSAPLSLSSSCSGHQLEYDVFLSFRVEDTSNNFINHLYEALVDKGIHTFKDVGEPDIGKPIKKELLVAIEKSKMAVILLSRDYAFSMWCLEELAKIVKCWKDRGLIVLPIFYHVDPRDVRLQTGTFADAFADHGKRYKEEKKVKRWRKALTEGSNLSGWHLEDRFESKVIKSIVEQIFDKLSYGVPIVGQDNLVRIDSHDVEVDLHSDLQDFKKLSSFSSISCDLTSPETPISFLSPTELSSLVALNLSDSNLFDGAFPEDLSRLSSLQSLDLSRNNFTCLPDSISQLSKLNFLYLDSCNKLVSLPKLPLGTQFVMARECISLKDYLGHVVVFTSIKTGFTIINCLRLAENEEWKVSEVSLLDIYFQPFWQSYMEEKIHQSDGFQNVLPQSEIPKWFSHQNNGSSVPILLPSDLYENSTWRGVVLCTLFVVHKKLDNVSPGKDSNYFHEFSCHFEDDGGLVDSPLVFTVPKEKFDAGSFGLWLYISHARLRDHIDVRSCISASITTNSPDIDIRLCGAHILYEKDMVDFIQTLSQENFRSLAEQHQHHGKVIAYQMNYSQSHINEEESFEPSGESESNPALKRKLKSLYQGDYAGNHWNPQPSSDNVAEEGCTLPETFSNQSGSTTTTIVESWLRTYFQNHYKTLGIVNLCFPQREIPQWFCHQSNGPSVTISLPPFIYNSPDWMGFAVSAVFSFHEHPTPICKNMYSRFRHRFMCHLKTKLGYMSPLLDYSITEDEAIISMEQHTLIWISFIPRGLLSHDWNQCTWVKFLFQSEGPGVSVLKSGVNLVHKQNMEGTGETSRYSHEDRRPRKRSCRTGPLDFDRCLIYNSCFPPSQILEWFNHLGDQSLVKIRLPPNLHNDCTWVGLALCASFSSLELSTSIVDNLDSKVPYHLICRLETEIGSLERLHIYRLLKEDLLLLKLGRFIWLSYIPCGLFPNSLNRCSHIEASISTDCPGLSGQNCGFRLLYQNDEEEFRETIRNCMASFSQNWNVIPQLMIDNEKTIKPNLEDAAKYNTGSSSSDEEYSHP